MVISTEVAARFWSYVQRSDEPGACWMWMGAKVPDGYGSFSGRPWGETQRGAHRVSWEIANGPIPHGAHVHHTCVVKGCVNPAHLELRSPRAHAREEGGFVPGNIAATHCPKGHPYAGENLYVNPQGKRACRECMRANARRWYADGAARARCSIDGCESPNYSRSWCIRHYNRWRTHGDPNGAGR